jgi:hypothetical protein
MALRACVTSHSSARLKSQEAGVVGSTLRGEHVTLQRLAADCDHVHTPSLGSGGAIFGTFVPGAARKAVWNHFCYRAPVRSPCPPGQG